MRAAAKRQRQREKGWEGGGALEVILLKREKHHRAIGRRRACDNRDTGRQIRGKS